MANANDKAFDMMKALTQETAFPWIEEENKTRRMHWLRKNEKKNFVKRIINPRLNRGREVLTKDNEFMTHAMSSADNFVYPTVVDMGKGRLVSLSGDDAYNYAMETGEFIETDSPEEANWLAKNYKTKKFKAGY